MGAAPLGNSPLNHNFSINADQNQGKIKTSVSSSNIKTSDCGRGVIQSNGKAQVELEQKVKGENQIKATAFSIKPTEVKKYVEMYLKNSPEMRTFFKKEMAGKPDAFMELKEIEFGPMTGNKRDVFFTGNIFNGADVETINKKSIRVPMSTIKEWAEKGKLLENGKAKLPISSGAKPDKLAASILMPKPALPPKLAMGEKVRETAIKAPIEKKNVFSHSYSFGDGVKQYKGHGALTQTEARGLLKTTKEGTYIIRGNENQRTLAFKQGNQIKEIKLQESASGLTVGNKTYPSFADFKMNCLKDLKIYLDDPLPYG